MFRSLFLGLFGLFLVTGSSGDPRKTDAEDTSDLEEPDELSDPADFADDKADDDWQ